MYWLEMHVHTALGSVDSTLDFYEMVDEYKKLGVDGICVTEHISFQPLSDYEYDRLYAAYNLNKKNKTGIDIFPGAEIKLLSGVEYLVYGIELSKSIFDLSWTKAVEKIHDSNGIIIKSHPFRDEDEFDLIDGIEIYNHCSSKRQNMKALEYFKESNANINTIGCDAHSLDVTGLAIMELTKQPKDEKDMISMISNKALYKYVVDGKYVSFE
jgi:histidinol phosphatase-like PHP family hydrolase